MALNKNAKKWVKALRSRKYKQTRHTLSQHGKFCCLGVACDLAAKAGAISEPEERGTYLSYDGEEDVLPESVKDWLGLRTATGSFTDKREVISNLADLNDGGKKFYQIARVMESEPEGLVIK